jgi:hypothetical protein
MSAVRVRLSPPNQKMILSLKEQLKKTVSDSSAIYLALLKY